MSSEAKFPLATYRVQLNSDFRFDDVRGIVDYLATLGITDIYSSPILKARPGSTHGYDVTDSGSINPELGGDEGLQRLSDRLHEKKLGLLLDIVPNHMAASADNPWWTNVLENGPRSRYSNFFDIDWHPAATTEGSERKILIPILGKPYGEVLESGEIQLRFDRDGFAFHYYDNRLPLAPESYAPILTSCLDSLQRSRSEGAPNELRDLIEVTLHRTAGEERVVNVRFVKETLWRFYEAEPGFKACLDQTVTEWNGDSGDPTSFDRLDSLLNAQWYRLAYWRMASEQINYRRFFDITELVGVRVEDPEVFQARHARIFELAEKGVITGLRIDHVDGLFNPMSHLQRLQSRMNGDWSGQIREPGFYVVVEKILEHNERLPDHFACSGTTGYEFLNRVNSLFIDPKGLNELETITAAFTGERARYDEIEYRSKRQVIDELFAGEIRNLAGELARLAALDRNARDFSHRELLEAFIEVTASLRVYRSYISDLEISETDRRNLGGALDRAERRSGRRLDRRVFAFLRQVLLVTHPQYSGEKRSDWLNFVMRWQQFTGRVTAKGVEDTAFYVFNRLISMNEVGGHPGHSTSDAVERFHRENSHTAERWPHTLNASSTHDTKRSEDVRARINVLSELAPLWRRRLERWSNLNANIKQQRTDGFVPDANEEIMIYQTLLGVWPLDRKERSDLEARLVTFVEKAAREAKVHTSWIQPEAEHEKALGEFCKGLLTNQPFLRDFEAFHRRIAHYGFLNSLGQLLLKVASPGTPDFYQGSELWDLSMVDPDNRRPVDFKRRARLLASLKKKADPPRMLRNWKNGTIKLFVTWKLLQFRREHAELFSEGDYSPIQGTGDHAIRVCAFTRARNDETLLVVVPRLIASLVAPPKLPLGAVWGSTRIELPESRSWRNVLTGETLEGGTLAMSDLLATFPIGMFFSDG